MSEEARAYILMKTYMKPLRLSEYQTDKIVVFDEICDVIAEVTAIFDFEYPLAAIRNVKRGCRRLLNLATTRHAAWRNTTNNIEARPTGMSWPPRTAYLVYKPFSSAPRVIGGRTCSGVYCVANTWHLRVISRNNSGLGKKRKRSPRVIFYLPPTHTRSTE